MSCILTAWYCPVEIKEYFIEFREKVTPLSNLVKEEQQNQSIEQQQSPASVLGVEKPQHQNEDHGDKTVSPISNDETLPIERGDSPLNLCCKKSEPQDISEKPESGAKTTGQ